MRGVQGGIGLQEGGVLWWSGCERGVIVSLVREREK